MKLTTRLIALLWLGIGSLTLFQAFQGVQMPLSLKFFATLQVLGALALLGGLAFGYVILITMSVFTMVTGIFALIAVPFMPAEMLAKVPPILGLPPRGVMAGMALGAVLLGRLCWLGLRRDPPANWGRASE